MSPPAAHPQQLLRRATAQTCTADVSNVWRPFRSDLNSFIILLLDVFVGRVQLHKPTELAESRQQGALQLIIQAVNDTVCLVGLFIKVDVGPKSPSDVITTLYHQ